MSSSNRPPKYCRNRQKNRADRAFVEINGKRIGLGVYGSPESKAKYAELIAGLSEEPAAFVPPDDPIVSELIIAYLEHARRYYQQPDGADGREYELSRDACKIVHRQAGSLRACEFSPKRLKAVRAELIEAGHSRKFINKQIDRVRRMFRWSCEEELVPASVPQSLGMVAGLRKGRTDAKELPPIRPVPTKDVDATVKQLGPVVADMAEVQKLTGMRPGELVIMRPMDIDRTAEIWLYTPESHKTKYRRGHNRTVAIGPRAQGVLLRYLARAGDDCLFQPRDFEAKRRAELTANRKTPSSCGNRPGTNCKAEPKKQPGEQYTVESYRRAIRRACERAKVERWTPHRLRHSMATEVRREFVLDGVQSVLGHKNARVSEVYAELDTAKAAAIAKKLG